MSLTIFHIGDQIIGYQFLSRIGIRQHFLQCVDDDMDDLDILLFIMTADIICLK